MEEYKIYVNGEHTDTFPTKEAAETIVTLYEWFDEWMDEMGMGSRASMPNVYEIKC